MHNVCNKCYSLNINHTKVVNYDELQDNLNVHWNEGTVSDNIQNCIHDIIEERLKSSSCISKTFNSTQQQNSTKFIFWHLLIMVHQVT